MTPLEFHRGKQSNSEQNQRKINGRNKKKVSSVETFGAKRHARNCSCVAGLVSEKSCDMGKYLHLNYVHVISPLDIGYVGQKLRC